MTTRALPRRLHRPRPRPLLAALLASLLPGAALADRAPANLKAFKTVCVNAGFEDQGQENEAIRTRLIQRLYAALDEAKIPAAEAPCQDRGLSSTGQLNLYFDFTSTQDGQTFNAILEGWLSKEGAYTSPTLWMDNLFGAMDAGSGALEAADMLDELLKGFIQDWQGTH